MCNAGTIIPDPVAAGYGMLSAYCRHCGYLILSTPSGLISGRRVGIVRVVGNAFVRMCCSNAVCAAGYDCMVLETGVVGSAWTVSASTPKPSVKDDLEISGIVFSKPPAVKVKCDCNNADYHCDKPQEHC